MGDTENTRTMDLGIDDVHIPSAIATQPHPRTMADLTTEERNKLPKSKFADPENEKYPIHDAKHVANAASRLEQQKGSMSAAKYRKIRGRIARAARKFGVESEYNKKPKTMRLRGRGLTFQLDHPVHGTLRIRQMNLSDKDARCPGIEIDHEVVVACAEKMAGPQWNQLAKLGRFFKDGSFFSIDAKTFSDIIRNFETSTNKRIPVDFEHASELRGSDGVIPILGAPAHGWITKIEARGDRLFGLVEWDDLARGYIRDGNYKFLSPAIRFGCKDTHTGAPIGARLTSAALTNIPFLDGMQPLAAKDEQVDTTTIPATRLLAYSPTSEVMPRLRAILELAEGTIPYEIREHFARLKLAMKSNGYNMEATLDGKPIGQCALALRELVSPSIDATWDDVLNVVEEMIETAIAEHNAMYHPGQAPAQLKDKEPNMDTKELEVQLKDAQSKNTELSVQLRNVDTDKAKLELQVKELATQLKEAGEQLANLSTEVRTLKDEKNARVEADYSAEVDRAVMAYGKSKGLSDADKPKLLKLLKADAESFRGLYPPVKVENLHLLRDNIVTQPGSNERRTQSTVPAQVPDMKSLILKYTTEDKMTPEAAISKAYTEVRAATALGGR